MLKILPGPVRGILALVLFVGNTFFWCIPLFLMTALKALLPLRGWRRGCGRVLNAIAENWIWGNNLTQRLTTSTRWDVQGAEQLDLSQWYLVLANHQSWTDIVVLQRVFHRKIPFLKIFIKKELFWLPFLGHAWWALDFPFIKRFSRQQLEQKPHLRGKDLEITRKACERFKQLPISIMNFVEGTRFTLQKHRQQGSPYTHLLKPRAGGIASVLHAMGGRIHRVLDVTIVYPGGRHSFWALICGRIAEVKVRVRSLPVGPELIGDAVGDGGFRLRFQQWLNTLWAEKDRQIDELTAGCACRRGTISLPGPMVPGS
ncbi:MAG: acyltransferase [Desulfobacterales bacterium]|nr:acyltransferase [Desulfobacterales bacterium]